MSRSHQIARLSGPAIPVGSPARIPKEANASRTNSKNWRKSYE
jgi:hypothetical protein